MEPLSKWVRLCNYIIDILVIRLALLRYGIYPILRALYPIMLTYSVNNIRFTTYIINGIVFIVYYFVMEATTGLTFGKLLTRTKVVTFDGSKPTTYDIFKRTLWRLVPFEPLSFLGITGWHDSQSKTIVISSIDVNIAE